MCKSPQAVQVTGKMLHFQSVCIIIQQILISKLNASFRLAVTCVFSFNINFVLHALPCHGYGTNYFVLLNDFHTTL